MFKHLLVPTDGSKMSADAVDRAVAFAREANAAITFFYVKPEFPIALYGEGALVDPTTPQQFEELAEQQASTILSACEKKASASGVPCTSKKAFVTASATSSRDSRKRRSASVMRSACWRSSHR